MKALVVVFSLFLLPGCCWLAKRDCFPACPPQLVVTIEKPCDLPPIPPPLSLKTTTDGCPPETICFDKTTAAQLAKHLSELNQWVLQVKSRCSSPASSPSTVPAK